MASNCDRCGKSLPGYAYCGGCVGDNTPMPKQVPPKCPLCDDPITIVSKVFDYRPNVDILLEWDPVARADEMNYIEIQNIGDNTEWHWEAQCGHEVSDP